MKRLSLIAIASVAIAAFLAYVSFGHDNAEAYLFPQIVGSCLLGLCVLLVAQEFFGNSDPAVKSVQLSSLLKLLPMLVLLAGYVYCIEWLGMYSSSAIALFLIAFIYHSADSMIKRFTSSLMVASSTARFVYIVSTIDNPNGITHDTSLINFTLRRSGYDDS